MELIIRRAGGREVSSEHEDIAPALWALLFCPFPAGKACPLWISQRQLLLVPASTRKPTPVPGGGGVLSGWVP